MSRIVSRTFSQAWADLKYQLASGKPQPGSKPDSLALKQVKRWPEVFQQRRPGKHASAAHVRGLAKKAAANPLGTLDAITVWWDGKGWACIDGHHRLEAYRLNSAGSHQAVPVCVFEGTLEQAFVLSAKANTRDKLQMASSEKSNAAWRMVVATAMSKAEIADAGDVSSRLVGYMRKAKTTLESRGVKDLADIRWEAARRSARGEAEEDVLFDDDEQERRAQMMAALLHKTLGAAAGKQVEVFSRALELYNSQLPGWLADLWQIHDNDLDA